MRTTTLASLLLMSHGLFAQAYIPLLDTSATWQDQFGSGDPGPGTSDSECYLYYMDGDSIVSGIAYKILRMTGMLYHLHIEPPYNTYILWYSGTPCGLVREDTAARQVFFRPPGFPWEYLLYDFSVGLGPYPDTYRYGPGWEVTAIDTVILADGPHRKIILSDWEEVIEGIGSLSGFMPGGGGGTVWMADLVCHTLNEIPNYEIVSLNCACGSNVGIPAHLTHSLHVSPSPTTDLCHLQGAPPNAPFRIRSMDGRIMRSGTCSNSGSTKIDMVDLPAAMYVVEVLDPTGSLKVKVLKE